MPSDGAALSGRAVTAPAGRAFESFERLFQVGSILDPDDPQCCEDEKANITYLAELMKAMPMREEDEEDGEGRRRVIREKHPRKVRRRCLAPGGKGEGPAGSPAPRR